MTSSEQANRYQTMDFEETDLCLGLPGRGGQKKDHENSQTKTNGSKRGFAETEAVDLKLNLSNSSGSTTTISRVDAEDLEKVAPRRPDSDYAKPPAKAQVVGWPPVRSYRKNATAVQKPSIKEEVPERTAAASSAASGLAFVKVSMDGAPYLRKVDLKMYMSYQELSNALAKMFGSFITENCEGVKDFMSKSKLVDLLDGLEYVSTYEDKDGDWMLVGDVPWGMFVESCKRVRIMKGSEATGLAPRAVEAGKSRS